MSKDKVSNLTKTALFAAIIVVLAQISIPFQPIPLTMSVFAIMLTGAMLQPKFAFDAALVYVALGAFGLPVFAGFKGGIGVVFGPTGGFILAYPIMSLLAALAVKHIKFNKIAGMLIGMVASLVVCYLMGSIWYVIMTKSTFASALSLCVVPFIPFDLLKAVAATFAAVAIQKVIPKKTEA